MSRNHSFSHQKQAAAFTKKFENKKKSNLSLFTLIFLFLFPGIHVDRHTHVFVCAFVYTLWRFPSCSLQFYVKTRILDSINNNFFLFYFHFITFWLYRRIYLYINIYISTRQNQIFKYLVINQLGLAVFSGWFLTSLVG